jgi:hypothetical protein
MTNNVAKLAQRGSQRQLPHLPPIARDPLDDAREILALFGRKQADELDVPLADLAEDLAAALRMLLALPVRPKRRELPVWKRLPVEQARHYSNSWPRCRATPRPIGIVRPAASWRIGQMPDVSRRLWVSACHARLRQRPAARRIPRRAPALNLQLAAHVLMMRMRPIHASQGCRPAAVAPPAISPKVAGGFRLHRYRMPHGVRAN